MTSLTSSFRAVTGATQTRRLHVSMVTFYEARGLEEPTRRQSGTALVNSHVGFRFRLAQRLPLFGRQLFRFEDHDESLERARESNRHLVDIVLDHGRSSVSPDVERLVEREANADRLGDLSFRHLLAVDEQGAGRALADAAAVVLEDEADDMLARRYRLVGGDTELVLGLVGKSVGKGRLAVLQEQPPAAEATADRGQDAAGGASVRHHHLGRDRPRLVLEVWRGALRGADHAGIVGELVAPPRQARPDRRICPLGKT